MICCQVWIHVWKKAHQIWKHVIHILWCTIHMWKSHSYVCETNVRSTCRTVLFFSVSNSSRETFSWGDINVFIPPYLSGRGHVAPRIYCMINVIRREGSRKERRRKKTNALFYVVRWFHYINPPAALSHKNPFTSQTLSLPPLHLKASQISKLIWIPHCRTRCIFTATSRNPSHICPFPSFFYATPSLESLMGPLKTQFIFIMRSLWTASSLYSPSQRRDWNWSLLLDVIVSKTWSQLGESTV